MSYPASVQLYQIMVNLFLYPFSRSLQFCIPVTTVFISVHFFVYLLQVASKRKTDKNAVLKKEEEKEETKVYCEAEKYQYICANLFIEEAVWGHGYG